jgi:WD40 repeat protein
MDTLKYLGEFQDGFQEEWKRSVISHIVSVSAATTYANKDLLKRTLALRRICSRVCCGEKSACCMHGGNRVLLFPDRQGYVEMRCHSVEKKYGYSSTVLLMPNHEDPYCFNGYPHSRDINACAFNADGKVFAAVGGPSVCVWHAIYDNNLLYLDLSQLMQRGLLVNHVALSDSGERVALGVTLEKDEGARCLVINTKTKKLLYNFKCLNNFFYMMGENIIAANALDKTYHQYDLNLGDKTWNILEQKQFLYDIYQRYEETKQKVCLKQGSEWLSTYKKISDNYLLKAWLDERVFVEETTGWIGAFFGR